MTTKSDAGSETFGRKMEEHRRLLEQLKKLSVENITYAVAILQSLLDPKLLVKLKAEAATSIHPEVMAAAQDEEALQNLLYKRVEVKIQDSRVVIKELDGFCARIVENKKPSAHETPFLCQVWSGEMYGDPKYEGVRKLLEDIKTINNQLKELNINPVLALKG
jgi:hypothetical protein